MLVPHLRRIDIFLPRAREIAHLLTFPEIAAVARHQDRADQGFFVVAIGAAEEIDDGADGAQIRRADAALPA